MIQVPVQDARCPELRKFLKLQPQRPRRETDLLRDAHDVFEGRALQ